ncbi:chemotaxis protein CheR [candidate division KSB1 bacterium]|nr:MAG: chemotaxis protein CheR [candidate division KSB1 bacterium]
MSQRVPNILLEQLSDFINKEMGLFFSKERKLDLLRGVSLAAEEFGFSDTEMCINWLLSSPLKKRQIEVLARYLTIGETYFFREARIIQALEREILPAIVEKRRNTSRMIRIWSAGCCSGEEPYSIAILLSRIIPDIESWKIVVLGTDINVDFLDKAQRGIYREWSFRNTPFWLREKYFIKTDDGAYEILPQIKRLVSFSYLNLVQQESPEYLNLQGFDIILCRNVLMYFSQPQVLSVINRFYQSLNDKGWLIVGSSEASHVLFPQFRTVNFPGAIVFQKDLSMEVSRAENVLFDMEIDDLIPATTTNYDFSALLNADNSIEEEAEDEDEFTKAVNFYEQGKYKLAAELFKTLLNDPVFADNPQVYILLAKSYANTGDLKHALHWCNKGVKKYRLEFQLYQLQAEIYQEMGKLDKALDALKNVIYLEPDSFAAYFIMGNLSKQLGKTKEAKKCFENAEKLLRLKERDDVLKEFDGITAGRMIHVIESMKSMESPG